MACQRRNGSRAPCPPATVHLASRLMVGTAHESRSFVLSLVPAPLPTLPKPSFTASAKQAGTPQGDVTARSTAQRRDHPTDPDGYSIMYPLRRIHVQRHKHDHGEDIDESHHPRTPADRDDERR